MDDWTRGRLDGVSVGPTHEGLRRRYSDLVQIITAPDPAKLAEQAAEIIGRLIADSPGPRVSLGLAGGSTPSLTYERLRSTDIDWTKVDTWLSDERWVPSDHEQSNARMARDALLDHVPATFHDIRWGRKRLPQAAAQEYAANLNSALGDRPDMVILGMGDDGHTASLFPGTDALHETDTSYVANFVPDKGWRLTATVPLLHSARHLVFLVTGPAKARVLAAVLAGETFPATLVAAGAENTTWLIDEAAAAHLDRA